ncbi:MlaD family protein [Gordonia sp. CPCC 205333]|uniref:MlaD family protein n=1 Tax=Gordonia sp. CPCC 205333 TaxID=3140790 RepID=UPI003AF34CE5
MSSFLRAHRNALSTVALLALLCLGIANLAFGSLGLNPLQRTFRVNIELPLTGGLHESSDVTYRGARIGTVDAIRLSADGVIAEATLDADNRPPASVRAQVANLSAAGEQYLNLIPTDGSPSLLPDGAIIGAERTATPRNFADVLSRVSQTMEQLDPAKLNRVLAELDGAFAGGAREISTIIDSIDTLVAALYDVLPETRALVTSGRRTLELISSIEPATNRFSDAATALFTRLARSNAELKKLFAITPTGLSDTRQVIGENRDELGDLLKTLDIIAIQAQLRTPALRLLAPNLVRGLGAWALVSHHGAFNVAADLLPRPTCEYDNPATAPATSTNPLPLKYMYCTSRNPLVGQRGAQNAPRPPGDDTAGPPPGANLRERVSG